MFNNEGKFSVKYYSFRGEMLLLHYIVQYSQGHSVINHCDRHITHLGDLDISFVLLFIFKISFIFRALLTITQKAYQNK